MEKTFPKAQRMRKTWEFNVAFKMGCKFHTPHFILLRKLNKNTCSRIGLTVSRKVGKAVQRNRVKRLVREFYRNNKHLFIVSMDYSIVAKKGAADLESHLIFAELEKALKKLEL